MSSFSSFFEIIVIFIEINLEISKKILTFAPENKILRNDFTGLLRDSAW